MPPTARPDGRVADLAARRRVRRSEAHPATAGEVFALVRSGAAVTRGALGRVTGLSRTAVSARLAALMGAGLVSEEQGVPVKDTGAGRPPSVLRVNAAAGVVLAAAVGRSRTQLAVCDLGGQVLAAADLDQEPGAGPDEVMPRVTGRLAALLGEAGRRAGDVMAVGLTIPGSVDVEAGVSLESPIMPGWAGVALAPYLRRLAEVPVVVDNDVNGMAVSERQGHLEHYRDLILVKASTGVGAGVVVDGRLIRGAWGGAGELGHTKTPYAEGRLCRCGDTGCLEAVAGGAALVQSLREHGRPVAHVRDVVALAAAGDPEARHLVRESGRRVGEVVAGAVNLLNPQALVVGGDMGGAYDIFAAGLRETLYAGATALATRELAVLPTTHGDRSGVIGCAMLALDEVLSPGAVDQRLGA